MAEEEKVPTCVICGEGEAVREGYCRDCLADAYDGGYKSW